jgi:uncharacterized membrane protein YsdA (DUF1294 family)
MYRRLLPLANGHPCSSAGAGKVAASLPLLPLYLFLINAATYFAFWIDKSRAQQGGYRISESTLLTLSFLGGSPAALFARRQLRHKTLKQPFTTQLFVIVALQVGVVVWMGRTAFS